MLQNEQVLSINNKRIYIDEGKNLHPNKLFIRGKVSKQWEGLIVFHNSKPSFIIQKAYKRTNEIRIVSFSYINKCLTAPVPKLLPVNDEITLKDFKNDIVFNNAFIYEGYILVHNNGFIIVENIVLLYGGFKINIQIVAQGYFFIFEIQDAPIRGIESHQNISDEKIGFINYGKKEKVKFTQSIENKKIYVADVIIDMTLVGAHIFDEFGNFLGIFIQMMTETAYRIGNMNDLENIIKEKPKNQYTLPIGDAEIPNSVDSGNNSVYTGSNSVESGDDDIFSYHNISITSQSKKIKPNDPPCDPIPSDQETSPKNKLTDSKFIEDNFTKIKKQPGKGSAISSSRENVQVNLPEITPCLSENQFCSSLIEQTIYQFDSNSFNPIKTPLPVTLPDDSTITTTNYGSIIITDKKVFLLQSGQLKLIFNLNHPRFLHSALNHKGKIFVIGGKNTQAVESFYLEDSGKCSEHKQEEDTPVAMQEAAACSVNDWIYAVNFEAHDNIEASAFRFNGKWEKLGWRVPKFYGMGMIHYDNDKVVLFGGKNNVSYNDKFVVLNLQGKEIATGEFENVGIYYNKSVGELDGTFCVGVDKMKYLEFCDGVFKTVAVGWDSVGRSSSCSFGWDSVGRSSSCSCGCRHSFSR